MKGRRFDEKAIQAKIAKVELARPRGTPAEAIIGSHHFIESIYRQDLSISRIL